MSFGTYWEVPWNESSGTGVNRLRKDFFIVQVAEEPGCEGGTRLAS